MSGKNPGKKEESRTPWGLEEIRAVLDLLAERGISEFEMEKNGFRVRVKRGAVSEPDQAPLVVQEPEAPLHKGAAVGSSRPGVETGSTGAEDLFLMKSPIVGTFYAAPKPGTPPYVTIGEAVRKGQILCIIEAMKLMNEIEAEADGVVAKIFAENGQPVEYGQSLFGLAASKPQGGASV
ncbi:MAG: acetyl-CoA carboxylase biotin carboxyl carrier protein [Terriglobia bacterium]